MVSLSFKCEEMMEDGEDNRQSVWFQDMLESLGLSGYTNEYYSERKVDKIIDNFLARNYEYDGKGGLFTVPNCHDDMRNAEIWNQMCWYLNTLIF